MNRVEVAGGVPRDAVLGEYNWLKFTVAVDDVRFNRDTQQREAHTTWVSVEWQVPGVVDDESMVYKGDAVHVVGELTQFKREGEKESHTRVRALVVTVTRRGREGSTAVTQAREEPWF